LVGYRDPEDGEGPEQDVLEDPNRLDVHGLHGLYVRNLGDLSVIETLPVDASIPTGTAIFGTGSTSLWRSKPGRLWFRARVRQPLWCQRRWWLSTLEKAGSYSPQRRRKSACWPRLNPARAIS